MKRRNFFKAIGGIIAAPVAAKAAEPEYDWKAYGAFHDPYTGKTHIGEIDKATYARDTYRRHAGYDYLNLTADHVEQITRHNAILAKLKAK